MLSILYDIDFSIPEFPRFQSPPEGGVTAWFTMRLTDIGEDRKLADARGLEAAIKDYEERDQNRTPIWKAHYEL